MTEVHAVARRTVRITYHHGYDMYSIAICRGDEILDHIAVGNYWKIPCEDLAFYDEPVAERLAKTLSQRYGIDISRVDVDYRNSLPTTVRTIYYRSSDSYRIVVCAGDRELDVPIEVVTMGGLRGRIAAEDVVEHAASARLLPRSWIDLP